MFEIKHLKTLTTLANTGTLRKAADALFISQSALSHQVKDLEQRLGTSLFLRNTTPVEFTDSGQILLNLANEILPKIESTHSALKAPENSNTPLKIAIDCHACFQWLLPVTTHFSTEQGNVALEFIDRSFAQYQQNKHSQGGVDVLFTDEKIIEKDFVYQEIGQFEIIAVLSKHNPLAKKQITLRPSISTELPDNYPYLIPEHFSQLTLLTYPISAEQLDIFKLFLTPAKCQPSKIKKVTSSHVMLQMVAADMGVATLPDWLLTSATQQSLFHCFSLGESGIHKKLYARYDKNSVQIDHIKALLPRTISAFAKLYKQ